VSPASDPPPLFLHRRLTRAHLWTTACLAAALLAGGICAFDLACRALVRAELRTLHAALSVPGDGTAGVYLAPGVEAGPVLRAALGPGPAAGAVNGGPAGPSGNVRAALAAAPRLCALRVLDGSGHEAWAWPNPAAAWDLQQADLSLPGRSLRTDLYLFAPRVWVLRWERTLPAGPGGGPWIVRLWFDLTPWLVRVLLPALALLLGALALHHVHTARALRRQTRLLDEGLSALEGQTAALLEGAPPERFEGGAFAWTRRAAELLNRIVTHLSQQTQQVEITHQRDPLTGLYTRRYLMDHMEVEIKRCKRYRHPMAFIMLDLDHFKRLNDEYGHQMGDQVLITVGQVLRANLRETDTCARYGGEEIALVLTETHLRMAMVLAEKLRLRIAAAPVTFQDKTVRVTASMGVTSFLGGEEDSMEEIVKRADQALYEAKRAGRNQVRRAI
jgi:diguanylate cyclase (GGDEF)-like protein